MVVTGIIEGEERLVSPLQASASGVFSTNAAPRLDVIDVQPSGGASSVAALADTLTFPSGESDVRRSTFTSIV
jgi:hypothetical protein